MASTNINMELMKSAMHILSMNDDALEATLGFVMKEHEIYMVSKVCKKFREIAQICYRPKDSMVTLNNVFLAEPLGENEFAIADDFLETFGHRIKNLEFNGVSYFDDDKFFASIAKHCGNKITTLEMYDCNVDFKKDHQFTQIEALNMTGCSVYNFQCQFTLRTTMKKLLKNYFEENCDGFIKPFPNLKEVQFKEVSKLNDEMIIKFLELNPQLESLKLKSCKGISTTFLQNIANMVPNLIVLTVVIDKEITQEKYDADIKHVSNLKN